MCKYYIRTSQFMSQLYPSFSWAHRLSLQFQQFYFLFLKSLCLLPALSFLIRSILTLNHGRMASCVGPDHRAEFSFGLGPAHYPICDFRTPPHSAPAWSMTVLSASEQRLSSFLILHTLSPTNVTWRNYFKKFALSLLQKCSINTLKTDLTLWTFNS